MSKTAELMNLYEEIEAAEKRVVELRSGLKVLQQLAEDEKRLTVTGDSESE